MEDDSRANRNRSVRVRTRTTVDGESWMTSPERQALATNIAHDNDQEEQQNHGQNNYELGDLQAKPGEDTHFGNEDNFSTTFTPKQVRSRQKSISETLEDRFRQRTRSTSKSKGRQVPSTSTLIKTSVPIQELETPTASPTRTSFTRNRGFSAPPVPQTNVQTKAATSPPPPRQPNRRSTMAAPNVSELTLNHKETDIFEVIDPTVATASDLMNISTNIVLPNFRPLRRFQAPPVVNLDLVASHLGKDIHHDIDKHIVHAHRKRDKVKRVIKGVWAYLKTPMGVLVAIYGIAVVFWGAGLVLILLNWIDLGDKKDIWVEICSQILNGLFTITGVGLIPFRAYDTYNIIIIHHYMRLMSKKRRVMGLPELGDENDMYTNAEYQTLHSNEALQPESISTIKEVDRKDYSARLLEESGSHELLTPEQDAKLRKSRTAFQNSQSWYRPHATPTHFAFPIVYALSIALLNDGNSMFQCMLCGCMWGLNRFERPAWTTGSLIPLSFLCGIIAAVLIVVGKKKTKRTKEVEEIVQSMAKET